MNQNNNQQDFFQSQGNQYSQQPQYTQQQYQPPIYPQMQPQHNFNAQPNKKGNALIISIISITAIIVVISLVFLLKGGYLTANKGEIIEIPSALSFVSHGDETEFGDLYYLKPGKDRVHIAKNVKKYGYKIYPESQIIYYITNDDTLYCYVQGEGKYRVADGVTSIHNIQTSGDGKTIAYSISENEKTSLYAYSVKGESEKITSYYLYGAKILPSGKIYYVDNENNLYYWTSEDGTEKVASDVGYNIVGENSILYSQKYDNGDSQKYSTYLKLKTDDSVNKISSDTVFASVSEKENAAFYISDRRWIEEKTAYAGDLYVCVENGFEIKIDSDVISFELSDNGKYIYYLSVDDYLYARQLPEITDSNSGQPKKLKNKITSSERIKIASDVRNYNLSSDGKRVLYVDKNETLCMSSIDSDKITLKGGVTSFYSSNNRCVFVTENKTLYINDKISAESCTSSDNVQIAKDVASYSVSTHCQNIYYITENSNELRLVAKSGKDAVLIQDVEEYDMVNVDDLNIYIKYLEESDITGYYSYNNGDSLLKLHNDETYELYIDEDDPETGKWNNSPNDKFNSYIYFTSDNNPDVTGIWFKKNSSGVKSISFEYEGDHINLTELTLKEYNAKKKAKEEYNAVMKKAKNYYYNGVYVYSTDTLYDSASYDSATTRTFTYSGTKSVSDYVISSDNKTIWLKLSARDGYKTIYVWVPKTV